jgi:hypothetical protein
MPRKIYDMLDLPPLEKCYYDIPIANVAKKLTITLFPLIFLLWMLNAMLHVLLTITLLPLIFLLWILKPLGRINDVLIMVNNNFVLIDFLVMDVECNASCPIILGRPFLQTIGAIIDMREGTIKYQFPLKKGMEHFPRKRKKLFFDSILRANYELDASSFDIT